MKAIINVLFKHFKLNTTIKKYFSTKIAPPTDRKIYTQDFFVDEYNEVMAYYPKIIEQIRNWDFIKNYHGLPDRYTNYMNWNVDVKDTKRMATALFTLYSYKHLEKPANQTEDNLRKAAAMSWAFRMAEASQLTIDDVLDNSLTRYMKPAWHKLEGTNTAILDAFFVENAAYLILQEELLKHPQFWNIVRLLKEYYLMLVVGQYLDMRSIPFERSFELLKYRNIKGYYITNMPIRGSMYLANIDNPDCHAKVEELLKISGEWIIIQNDYQEIFLSTSEYKKDRRDIQQGTNTWCLAKALEFASESQMKALKENYGKNDDESARKIEQIYHDLKLDEIYLKIEQEYFEKVNSCLESLPGILPKSFFWNMMHIIKNEYMNG
uniref:Terpene synthase n=1 Tax=Phyllotreta armoraciae TaxID=1553667 RepID=A0A140AZ70_9CUCU|nr:terpene synthase [Phyllotreta armoraciae]